MRRRTTSLILLAGALLAASPAWAQEEQSELEQSLGRPKRAPDIPPELRSMVREATRDRLVVIGLDGADIPIDIRELEPESFAQYGDGRYFGFSFIGYEFYGYRLVDRAMRGDSAIISTGAAPVFSPDGRHFAAVQFSGAGFGDLEGLGLWEVGRSGTAQIYFSDVVPEGDDWRVDGWPREDCVSMSMVAQGGPPEPAEGPEAERQRTERHHFGIELGPPLTFRDSYDHRACNVVDATDGD